MSYRKFRALQEKRKTLAVQSSTATAPKPPEKEKVTVPTQAERRELFKKQRFRQKAVAAKKPAPQAPAPPADVPAPTPPPYRVQMQRLKRRHLTREVVRRYLQRQTATTAAASTAPLVTQAPKLPTTSHKQATVDAISRGVHYIAAKIKALLSQTVRRAAQSLLALLGAGCVVLVLAMVIGAAAAVIGSPMGILFANEYPAILARKMLTATPAIAVRIFPRRRVRLSWLLTAVRSSFPAGTIAMATKFCWITARACLRGMPT